MPRKSKSKLKSNKKNLASKKSVLKNKGKSLSIKKEEPKKNLPKGVVDSYSVSLNDLNMKVDILSPTAKEFIKTYSMDYPEYAAGTKALLDDIKQDLLARLRINIEQVSDLQYYEKVKVNLEKEALNEIEERIPSLSSSQKKMLSQIIATEMLGLGRIDFVLADSNIEEIVINGAKVPVFVYTKKHGWLKSNIFFKDEKEIENYSSIIARRAGKQITVLSPLLDAHLMTGDRANATLFPISNLGNTITIRRFSRHPWTAIDLIKTKTVSSDVFALIWAAMEYEMNIIFSGGTASGKTTMLGACIPFIQPSQRMISIEDTREINPPSFMHWVPLTTREANQEGKGEITMLDLLVNSLRMRPDRIIVGEIRRAREAEVMFEAMHTGHSVYTTFHATTSDETIRRFTNPPIQIPPALLGSVNLNVVMFRNRRIGKRRILEISEFIAREDGDKISVDANVLYRWRAHDDSIVPQNESVKFFDDLALNTGLSKDAIIKDLREKSLILDWLVKRNLNDVEKLGKIIAHYYLDKEGIISAAKKNLEPEKVL